MLITCFLIQFYVTFLNKKRHTKRRTHTLGSDPDVCTCFANLTATAVSKIYCQGQNLNNAFQRI